MSYRLNITSGRNASDEVEVYLKTTVSRGVRKLKEPTEKFFRSVYRALRSRHGDRFPSGGLFGRSRSKSSPLMRRSGRGLMSIRNSISVDYDRKMGVEGSISSAGMTVHETGATVTGRPYLAIPTIYAMTSRGQERRQSPRNWPNSFTKRSRKGNLFVFRRESGSILPLYLLKKKVKIPARLGLQDEFNRQAPRFIAMADAEFGRAVQ